VSFLFIGNELAGVWSMEYYATSTIADKGWSG